LVASVLHFYALSYSELLKLPIYTFWELSRNIDRVRADEDKRLAILLSQVIVGDPAKFGEALDRERGVIIEITEEHKREAMRESVNKLRAVIRR